MTVSRRDLLTGAAALAAYGTLPRAYGAVHIPSWRGADALYVCRKLGLTSGFQLALDAGDAASYTSGESWLDRSGNGYDFFRGATGAGGEASDPTFNGSAGGLSSSEYWSHDGGDYFTYDTTNEAWMNTLHKDSAVGTILFWAKPASLSVNQGLFGTGGAGAANIGMRILFTSAALLGFICVAGGTTSLNVSSDVGLAVGAWRFCGVSWDEAASSFTFYGNGTTAFQGVNYTSPSASNATFTAQIGAAGNAAIPVASGTLMAMTLAWTVALSIPQMNALFNATRGRFGV